MAAARNVSAAASITVVRAAVAVRQLGERRGLADAVDAQHQYHGQLPAARHHHRGGDGVVQNLHQCEVCNCCQSRGRSARTSSTISAASRGPKSPSMQGVFQCVEVGLPPARRTGEPGAQAAAERAGPGAGPASASPPAGGIQVAAQGHQCARQQRAGHRGRGDAAAIHQVTGRRPRRRPRSRDCRRPCKERQRRGQRKQARFRSDRRNGCASPPAVLPGRTRRLPVQRGPGRSRRCRAGRLAASW